MRQGLAWWLSTLSKGRRGPRFDRRAGAGTRADRSGRSKWDVDFWEVLRKGRIGSFLHFWNYTVTSVWRMDYREMWLETGKPVRKPLKSFTQEEIGPCCRSGCGDEEKSLDLGYILAVELTWLAARGMWGNKKKDGLPPACPPTLGIQLATLVSSP